MAETQRPATIGYILRKFPVLSETFVLNEILGLEARDVPIKIFSVAPPRDPKYHEGVVRLEAPITYVPGIADYESLLKYVRAAARRYRPEYRRTLWRVLATGRPTLVWRFLQAAYIAERAARLRIAHFHAHFATRATTVARLASRISGIPYSFTAHACDIYRSDVDMAVLRRKIEDARFVVTISQSNVEFLQQVANGRADKIRLLHNGIDLETFTPCAAVPEPPFTILSIARLVEKKGLDVSDRSVPGASRSGFVVSLLDRGARLHARTARGADRPLAARRAGPTARGAPPG
jgi:colanic acid/amylovoran biosynthesis glycosyltransferase